MSKNTHTYIYTHTHTQQDIEVTYDQIGGLVDVKETLRQCVTYPLRFPHLYSEGIAAESVKGVCVCVCVCVLCVCVCVFR